MRRPQAHRPNPWAGLIGLIGYAIVAAPVVWGIAALVIAMQPPH